MKVVKECTWDGCGHILDPRNKTGFCKEHFLQWKRDNSDYYVPTRTCAKCSTMLRKENTSGLCAKHIYTPRECACGKKLRSSNQSGKCRTCKEPIHRIPHDRRDDYFLMKDRLRSSEKAAEWILSGKHVPQNMRLGKPTKSSAQILAYVSAEMGFPVELIVSRRRFARLIPPRAVATEAMRRCNYSFTQISKRLGKEDHSTAVFYRDKFVELSETDASLERIVRQAIA